MINFAQILGLPQKPAEDVLELMGIAQWLEDGIFSTVDGRFAFLVYFSSTPMTLTTWFAAIAPAAASQPTETAMRIWMGFYPYPVRRWINEYTDTPIHTPHSRLFWGEVASTYMETGQFPRCIVGGAWFASMQAAQSALREIKEGGGELFEVLSLSDILAIYETLFPYVEEGTGSPVPQLTLELDEGDNVWASLYLNALGMGSSTRK